MAASITQPKHTTQNRSVIGSYTKMSEGSWSSILERQRTYGGGFETPSEAGRIPTELRKVENDGSVPLRLRDLMLVLCEEVMAGLSWYDSYWQASPVGRG